MRYIAFISYAGRKSAVRIDTIFTTLSCVLSAFDKCSKGDFHPFQIVREATLHNCAECAHRHRFQANVYVYAQGQKLLQDWRCLEGCGGIVAPRMGESEQPLSRCRCDCTRAL